MSGKNKTFSNEYQRKIYQAMRDMSGKYSLWQIWQDFIEISAISIANMIENPYREKREQEYLRIAGKYSKEELMKFAEMLGEVFLALNENPEQDFLGELFMSLDLGNEWEGQFFTPYSVCRLMASLTIETKKDGWTSCNDPACGAGALLIAAANEYKSQGIDYKTSVLFTAQDVDSLAAYMCYIQMAALGCPGYVYIGNTLSDPCKCYNEKGLFPEDSLNVWYTPEYFNLVWKYSRRLI